MLRTSSEVRDEPRCLFSGSNRGYLYGQPIQRIGSQRIFGSIRPAIPRWIALDERIPKPSFASFNFTAPTTREIRKKLILAAFKLLRALGWGRISQQLQLGSTSLSVLCGCWRECDSNGVIVDCRGSFPTSVFFSTSRKLFDWITNVSQSQTTP